MVADIPVPGPVLIGNGTHCKQRVWVAIAVILGASGFFGGGGRGKKARLVPQPFDAILPL
jgi:hypothetical protein